MNSEQRLKLAVIGASGRTGGLILKVLHEYPTVELVAAVVSPGSKHLGSVALASSTQGGAPVLFSSDVAAAVKNADVCIDFSTPSTSLAACRACAMYKVPILVATTGHTTEQSREIGTIAKTIPVLLAPNTSLAVFAARAATKLVQKILGSAYDIEIVELHHRHKKDLPSGTALSLAKAACEGDPSLQITSRHEGLQVRGAHEVGVTGIRGGDAPGEHTVYFLGAGERIEITQRATDRAVFARGAVQLAQLLIEREAQLYTVEQLLIT